MDRIFLSDTSDWVLEFPDDQDVRGYRVLDKDGNDTGLTVVDMIVDPDQKRVDAVSLSDGSEYPARDLSIGDGVIYATDGTYDGTRRVADIDRYGTVVPRARV